MDDPFNDWLQLGSCDVYTMPIQKSEFDEREYRVVRLKNGLKATLVSDAKAREAAVTMNIAVGHLADPEHLPSFTMLCLRLLFLGTKEYPKATDFHNFLTVNRGTYFASADASNSTFSFTISTSKSLVDSLYRFSAFFQSPLFSTEAIGKELLLMAKGAEERAVDVPRRVSAVLQHLSSTKSRVLRQPYTENPLETLRLFAGEPDATIDELCNDKAFLYKLRSRIVEWFQAEYCAGRMDLCIVGNLSLDDLTNTVVARFSSIPNRGADPFPMVHECSVEVGLVQIHSPEASIPQLQLTLPIPSQVPFWRHKPALLLSILVEQKTKGSLHAHLSKKGWISALRCAPRSVGGARGVDVIELTLDLTKDGLLKYREVLQASFSFFDFLRSNTEQFPDHHQRDVSVCMTNAFRLSSSAPVPQHSRFIAETMRQLQFHPPELLLASPRCNWEWGDEFEGAKDRGDEREMFLTYVKNARPENVRVVVITHQAGEQGDWEEEPVTKTKFRKQELGMREVPDLKNEFSLPGPNEFIPLDVTIAPVNPDLSQKEQEKEKVHETPLMNVWRVLVKDRVKTGVVIDIRSQTTSIMTLILAHLIQEALVGTAYPAFLAGHQYTIIPTKNGMQLVFSGILSKGGGGGLNKVVERVLEGLVGEEITDTRIFESVKAIRDMALTRLLRPSRDLADEVLTRMLTAGWMDEEVVQEMQGLVDELSADEESILRDEVETLRDGLVKHARVRVVVTGSGIAQEEIRNFTDPIEQHFRCAEKTWGEMEEKDVLLPPGCNLVRVEKPLNPAETSSALSYYLQLPPAKDATGLVLSRLLYISLSSSFKLRRCELSQQSHGLIISIEGEPSEMEVQLEEFLKDDSDKGVKGFLGVLNDPDILDLKGPDPRGVWSTDLEQLVKVYGGRTFEDGLPTREHLVSVTIADVRSVFATYVHPDSTIRAKLSVHMKAARRRISLQAREAFKERVQDVGVGEQACNECDQALGDDAGVEEFRRFWESALPMPGGDEILELIPTLVAKYPFEGEETEKEGNKILGATYVGSVEEFKTTYRRA